MAFKGWPESALAFYEGLEADNSKTYWLDHKDVAGAATGGSRSRLDLPRSAKPTCN
jgi:hypothetical protein